MRIRKKFPNVIETGIKNMLKKIIIKVVKLM